MRGKWAAIRFDKSKNGCNLKLEIITDAQLTGRFDFPKLKKTNFVPRNVIPFNMAMSEKETKNKWVHFFIDDYQFERIWNYPNRYIELLQHFEGVITPDFSMLKAMPKAQRIWNCYRNRALAYYLQKNNVNIVPSVGWAEYDDMEWCLDGLPIDSVLAIEIYGCRKSSMARYGLLKGIERINRVLEPRILVIYGKEIKSINSICKNVIWLKFCKRMLGGWRL